MCQHEMCQCNLGEEIQASKSKTNEILFVYLRKGRVFILLTWIKEFGGLEALSVRIVGQALCQYLPYDRDGP